MTRTKIYLLTSFFIANIGEWVYFIALNLIILALTSSATSVTILYLFMPIAMLVTNSWAGSFVDRVNIKKLVIYLHLLRAILILILVMTTHMLTIYILTFFIQIFTAIYTNAIFVYSTKVISENEQQRFNAWRSMAQSSGFILGPMITGLFFFIGTAHLAIVMNSIALIIAALLLGKCPHISETGIQQRVTFATIQADWRIVYLYAHKHLSISFIFILNGLFIVCLTAIDSLEAAFATRTLQMSESTYGLLVSIAGIGFIAGSICNMKWLVKPLNAIFYGVLCCSVGYLCYGLAQNWWMAALGFFILSFANSFVSVGFMTYIQQALPAAMLGRFTAIFSLLEAFTTITILLLLSIGTQIISLRILVLLGTCLLWGLAFLYGVYYIKHRSAVY
ncbi:MFS transporter [Lysinibacillus louembei]|uniref:MFS transporter n=1 Tax=Lysinibacillus louembei TaxID=1470088 RepID=A0ABZ0RWB0_9BACI|nr:MFS transporter [Lysinibacillus louembei]WPK11118.1 MFS transporter [Lysinibacillus louembei]